MQSRFVLALLGVLLSAVSVSAADKKIVFLAGGPSHGPGEHEHRAGSLLLNVVLIGSRALDDSSPAAPVVADAVVAEVEVPTAPIAAPAPAPAASSEVEIMHLQVSRSLSNTFDPWTWRSK